MPPPLLRARTGKTRFGTEFSGRKGLIVFWRALRVRLGHLAEASDPRMRSGAEPRAGLMFTITDFAVLIRSTSETEGTRGYQSGLRRKAVRSVPVLQTGKTAAAAGLLWAGLCAPCAAQLQDYAEPERLGPSIVDSARGRSDFVRPDGTLFPNSRPGVGVTSTPYTRSDGSTGVRSGIIGSLALAPNTELGIGVFSVTRYKGEPDFKRTEPMRDVAGRPNNRLAAVGVKVRF
jgi:hypothetical protein